MFSEAYHTFLDWFLPHILRPLMAIVIITKATEVVR